MSTLNVGLNERYLLQQKQSLEKKNQNTFGDGQGIAQIFSRTFHN